MWNLCFIFLSPEAENKHCQFLVPKSLSVLSFSVCFCMSPNTRPNTKPTGVKGSLSTDFMGLWSRTVVLRTGPEIYGILLLQWVTRKPNGMPLNAESLSGSREQPPSEDPIPQYQKPPYHCVYNKGLRRQRSHLWQLCLLLVGLSSLPSNGGPPTGPTSQGTA